MVSPYLFLLPCIWFIFSSSCRCRAQSTGGSGSYPRKVANIAVLSPANNEIVPIATAGPGDSSSGSSGSISIEYKINAFESLQKAQTCVELVDSAFGKSVVKPSCFASSNTKVTLSDIAEGDYLLYLYLTAVTASGEPIDSKGTLTITRFLLVNHNRNNNVDSQSASATPPAINIGSQYYDIGRKELHLTTVDNAVSQKVDVVAPVVIQDIGFDQRHLEVCIKILNSVNVEVLKYSCVPAIQAPDITFSLPYDRSYTSYWVLKNVADNSILMGTLQTIGIVVTPLSKVLPRILLPRPTAEFGIPPQDTHSGEIKFEFLVSGTASAVDLVQVCMDMSDDQQGNVLLAGHCFKKGTTYAVLNQLARGSYSARLYLQQQATAFHQSAVSLTVIVKDFEEFVPSYDWQVIHEWQTLPNGLETRLPMSGSAYKEARIPVPWRLQLSMPAPCTYFLRMNVKRDTQIEEILSAAGRRCKMEAACFSLTADEENLPRDVTVEASALFNKKYSLEVDPTCKIEDA